MAAIITVIVFIIFGVLVFLIKALPDVVSSDISSKNLFVCQRCGEEFYPRWHEMVFGRWTLYGRGEVKLRCPHCEKKQWCHEKRK